MSPEMTATVTEMVIRRPSNELLKLINSWADSYVKAKELQEKIIKVKKKDSQK